ncbi:hypothetical protein T440DRAFT_455777 [Plenodomus tracheiphilus IPT5]|uniref:GmrSD restriction endonucleases N-terminal domain-containing protein n=1 Tax=Plenodomus tracheiphilus IPT5 TaxID=1408161 RepID=A0A6A7AWT8_9PLEO|nr:hypothetical protein T440DRAFT_455777 [Plenodomus tracheiphilus IPT5]
MPGPASMEMSTTTTSCSSTKQELHEDIPLRTFIKDEPTPDRNGDFSDNADDAKDDESYRPRPQLPRPQVNLRSLADLMRGLEDGNIDVNPDYQREVVWTADRMTGLVNSLMENFYIPPIILNGKQKRIVEDGGSIISTTYVCVDGKQRLSSVRAFIKGMIPCHDHHGEKWWFSDEGSIRRRKVLPEAIQKAFLNKDFVAYQFEALTQEQEEDLFARVQMGMTLTAAEKMRASSGPWQELARLFVDDFPTIYALMKDRARAKDFQLTLSCFSQIVEVMHPTAPTGIPVMKTNHSALPKFLSNKGLVDDGIKSHLASVWNTLRELIEVDPNTFTNANKYLGGVQTFAPVEMVAVTIMISMYSETRNIHLLLGDIRALREELRRHFVDLRLNAVTWKFIWEYLDDLEGIRGTVDGSTVDRRRADVTSAHSLTAIPLAPPSSTSAPAALAGSSTQVVTRKSSPPDVLSQDVAPVAVLRTRSRPRISSSRKASPRQSISADSEARTATPPSHVRPPKRQRTKAGPSSIVGQNQGGVISHPEGVLLYDSPEMTPTVPQRFESPVSTELNDPSIRTSLNGHTPHHISPRLPLPLPSQLRQNHISGLHNYRKSSFTPSNYLSPYSTFASSQQNTRTTASPRMPSTHSKHGPKTSRGHSDIGLGAYSPANIDEQWEGIVRSISPQVPPQAIPATSSAQLQTREKIMRNTRGSPAQQAEDIIDLTSDAEVEQERQNLLSFFKGRSAASSAKTQRSPIVEAEAALDKVRTVLNNPYAMYKNQDE